MLSSGCSPTLRELVSSLSQRTMSACLNASLIALAWHFLGAISLFMLAGLSYPGTGAGLAVTMPHSQASAQARSAVRPVG